MKKLTVFIATIALSAAHAITPGEFSQAFENYNACFILYSLNEQKTVSEYNPNNRCNQQISPNSTFKIALSLMAFDQGLINQNTVFKWDGKKRDLSDWNQDQTPQSWFKYSAVWVSQQLTPQLGADRIKEYLAKFDYGNQDFNGDPGKHNGLTHAWLSSSLKLSALEQLDFLTAMLNSKLLITHQAVANTQKNMYQGKLNNGANYYGKTGSGRQGNLRQGWFVGFIEHGAQRYVFVSNLTDKTTPAPTDKAYGSQILKPMTIKLLNDYFG